MSDWNYIYHDGMAIAAVSNEVAGKILKQASGRWTEKDFVTSGKKTVFVFNEGFDYGNNETRVIVRPDDYLIG